MSPRILAAALAAAVPLSPQAQQQVRPPIALYWMSVETAGAMSMGLPAGMAGMLAPGMTGGRRMKLDLGSSQPPAGEPRAAHAIPAALSMGPSLPLVTPRAVPAPAARPEDDAEEQHEPPKGRMLIYWGCGEAVRAGQPVILDFASMNPQEAARAVRSRSVSRPRGPAPGRSRTYGTWPNQEDTRAIPASGSLKGDHVIAGSYTPEIRFAVGERHDFMAPVAFDPVRKTPGGAFVLKWAPLPTAIGYFATAVGQGEKKDDIVMWSSSEVQEMGHALMDYLPPAEVARLIREKVVMPPQTNECAVPAGVFGREGAMLNFIGYGDELNLVHPPRPKDRNEVWEPQWAVKLRLKSTAMTMLAESEAGETGARRGSAQRGVESPAERAAEPEREASPAQAEQPKPASPADAVREGVRTLRRILPF